MIDANHRCSWSHPYLTSLDYNGVVSQMTQLEDALQEIVGVKPAYMRPPYLATNDVALGALGDLGYHVISCSIDTKDYENDDPSLIANSVNKFNDELNGGGSIVLSHDVHEQTVYTLAQAMLDEVKARGLTRMFHPSSLLGCSVLTGLFSCYGGGMLG